MSSRFCAVLLFVTCCHLQAESLPLARLNPLAMTSLARAKSTGRAPLMNKGGRSLTSRTRNLLVLMAKSSNEIGGPFTRSNILKGLGSLVLGVPAALEVYSRLGARGVKPDDLNLLPTPSLGSWSDVKHVTLVFHGAGGQDQYTDALMKRFHEKDNRETYSAIVDWSAFSSNVLQASFSGQEVGRLAMRQLVKEATNLESIHIIGISVGAFGADAACEEARRGQTPQTPYLQLTLLDPFTQRGIVDAGYGGRSFGRNADYTQQFLNTDDPVPSTNAPLPSIVCYDITELRPDSIPFGHDWPVAYYARKADIGLVKPENRLEPGSLVMARE